MVISTAGGEIEFPSTSSTSCRLEKRKRGGKGKKEQRRGGAGWSRDLPRPFACGLDDLKRKKKGEERGRERVSG